VNGDISRIMEAERRRRLEEAARAAAAEAAARATPAPTPAPGVAATPPPAVTPPSSQSTSGAAAKAVKTAQAQIGKPYEWGASGPSSYDCSGLTMYAWRSAGVSLPHSSRAQYESLPKVSRANIRPGDLLFYGSPIHHVGMYEGGGIMINAPETGENVRRDPIARSDYVGAARPG
jgi:cell wall-associated NlpC family hydrolase